MVLCTKYCVTLVKWFRKARRSHTLCQVYCSWGDVEEPEGSKSGWRLMGLEHEYFEGKCGDEDGWGNINQGSRCPDEVSMGPCWLLRNMILLSREETPPVVVSKRFFGWYVSWRKERVWKRNSRRLVPCSNQEREKSWLEGALREGACSSSDGDCDEVV